MVQPFRILVVDPDPPSVELITRTASALRATEIVSVATAEAAPPKLSDPERPFDLVFTALDLPDMDAPTLVKWTRAYGDSQRPNVPMVVMHEGPLPSTAATEIVNAGTRLLLQKPLTQRRIAAFIDGAGSAYHNFIISPTYIGPERRGAKRPIRDERRITASSAVLIVEDATNYELGDDTMVVIFDYLRLRVSGADLVSFRDFLTREHLQAALRNRASVQRRTFRKVERQQGVLEASLAALEQEATGEHLKRMNRAAWTIAADCASAGWTLMASVAKSLHHYTSGAYRPSQRLVRFLASHVLALKTALTGRIFDDGGRIGQTIVATVRSAELMFRRDATSPSSGV
ncbi:MAG: response regulator [Proteobacteria bacterium]|nr:response regulator [Pseudomonadota bacterium]MBI3498341.1 response regulator [Pseudomonadota bacterium]